ncbi:hypothetical protein [Algoriphagus confluentis]|uniref:XRE family transcriptional regulator n=1 Tax=Algoriphagus confluentis TaxID=1697556 RepID=A0ABQ6PUQ4_9BACT|nr:hypothetical protein Aconfl_43340 [Algoriphagus confluentis]
MNSRVFLKVGKIDLAIQWVEQSLLPDFAEEVDRLKDLEKIQFRILEADPFELTVRVTQGKLSEGGQKSGKELSDLAKMLFRRYFPFHTIYARPIPYREIPAEEMTGQVVSWKLSEQGISLDKITKETGIPKQQLHAWVSGAEPMDAVARAMFYYLLR